MRSLLLRGGRARILCVMDQVLAAELSRMASEDQRFRTWLQGAAHGFILHIDLQSRMQSQRIDVTNTDRLREIVSQHGWPGRSLVGDEGAITLG